MITSRAHPSTFYRPLIVDASIVQVQACRQRQVLRVSSGACWTILSVWIAAESQFSPFGVVFNVRGCFLRVFMYSPPDRDDKKGRAAVQCAHTSSAVVRPWRAADSAQREAVLARQTGGLMAPLRYVAPVLAFRHLSRSASDALNGDRLLCAQPLGLKIEVDYSGIDAHALPHSPCTCADGDMPGAGCDMNSPHQSEVDVTCVPIFCMRRRSCHDDERGISKCDYLV